MANGNGNGSGGIIRFWGVIVIAATCLIWVGRMSNKLDTVAQNQREILAKIAADRDTLSDRYRRSDAIRDWDKQAAVDHQQDMRIEKLLELVGKR